MTNGTPRQRVLDALAHVPPDSVPVDVGGSFATTMVDTTYERLKAALGIEAETRYFNRRARQAALDEATLERLGTCARPLVLGRPDVAGHERPDGTIVDEWGVGWRAAGGHYLPVENPLAGATDGDLAAFSVPDPDDPGRYRGLRETARSLRADGRYASVLSLPVAAVHLSQYLRGYDEFLMDLLADPSFAGRLMGRVMEFYLRVVENALDAVGADVDVVAWGEDVAFQDRAMVRPEVLSAPHPAAPRQHHRAHQAEVRRGRDVPLLRRGPRPDPGLHRDRRRRHQPGPGLRGRHGRHRGAQARSSGPTSRSGVASTRSASCRSARPATCERKCGVGSTTWPAVAASCWPRCTTSRRTCPWRTSWPWSTQPPSSGRRWRERRAPRCAIHLTGVRRGWESARRGCVTRAPACSARTAQGPRSAAIPRCARHGPGHGRGAPDTDPGTGAGRPTWTRARARGARRGPWHGRGALDADPGTGAERSTRARARRGAPDADRVGRGAPGGTGHRRGATVAWTLITASCSSVETRGPRRGGQRRPDPATGSVPILTRKAGRPRGVAFQSHAQSVASIAMTGGPGSHKDPPGAVHVSGTANRGAADAGQTAVTADAGHRGWSPGWGTVVAAGRPCRSSAGRGTVARGPSGGRAARAPAAGLWPAVHREAAPLERRPTSVRTRSVGARAAVTRMPRNASYVSSMRWPAWSIPP